MARVRAGGGRRAAARSPGDVSIRATTRSSRARRHAAASRRTPRAAAQRRGRCAQRRAAAAVPALEALARGTASRSFAAHALWALAGLDPARAAPRRRGAVSDAMTSCSRRPRPSSRGLPRERGLPACGPAALAASSPRVAGRRQGAPPAALRLPSHVARAAHGRSIEVTTTTSRRDADPAALRAPPEGAGGRPRSPGARSRRDEGGRAARRRPRRAHSGRSSTGSSTGWTPRARTLRRQTGKNDFGDSGWAGPCPRPAAAPHYASASSRSTPSRPPPPADLGRPSPPPLKGTSLAEGRLVGTYLRR